MSDFHLMTLTVITKSFKKLQPRIINYIGPTKISRMKNLRTVYELRKKDFVNNDRGFERFCNISMNVLKKHAPRKKIMLEVIKYLL